jgi:hypothetical protein
MMPSIHSPSRSCFGRENIAKDGIVSKALTDHCRQRNECDKLHISVHTDLVSFHLLELPPVNIEQFLPLVNLKYKSWTPFASVTGQDFDIIILFLQKPFYRG